MKVLASLALVLLAVSSHGLAAAAPARPVDADLYAVYLNGVMQPLDDTALLVRTETSTLQELDSELKSWRDVQKALPKVDRSAAADLFARSALHEPIVLAAKARPGTAHIIQAPAAEISRLFKTEEPLDVRWTKFHERFKNTSSIVSFSNIGYSTDFKQAVFVMNSVCGTLCGGGELVLMERTEDGWRVVARAQLWVS